MTPKFKTRALVAAAAALMSFPITSALADEQTDEQENSGTVESMNALHSGSGNSYRAAAEYALGQNQIDKALGLCKKALEYEGDDPDLHQMYAKVLERKLAGHSTGATHDQLLSECVHQWLIVLRNETGEEKGTSFHGIGLPLVGTFYEDDERHLPAKSHLISLVGRIPHAWETDAKYMKNVLKNQSTVQGKIVSREHSN